MGHDRGEAVGAAQANPPGADGAVRAVLDTLGEAVVLTDREGRVTLLNRCAAELFEVVPSLQLHGSVVGLRRHIALSLEDPEGFMEAWQQLRDAPLAELAFEVEQVLPVRRQLSVRSVPVRDGDGLIVGRVEVYNDITEARRREAEVAALLEQARKTAESYQRSLLPESVPRVARMSFVAHYVPAAGRRAVCGDFYDFIPLARGQLALVLGDVMGTGPDAVNDAALARYTLRSISDVETDPGRLLEHLNALLAPQLGAERFVRLLIAVLDPARTSIDYANAGHVPPIVYRARDSTFEWLAEGGIALGVQPDARYSPGRLELDAGDTLVLYTDGLTEANRHGRPLGQGKLTDLVTEYGVGTPGELVQGLRRAVDAWVSDEALRDDLAVVVCQVARERADEAVRELVLPNEPARVGAVRRFVAAFLADLGCPVDTSSEILLAVGEAAANAARHGRRDEARSELRVHCQAADARVVVTIADDGGGFDPAVAAQLPRDQFASGGRGLFLMRELMDDVVFESGAAGTTVRLVRAIAPEDLPDAAFER